MKTPWRMTWRNAFYFLPLLLWMGVIFAFSTRAGASENSLRLVERLLNTLAPNVLAALTTDQLDRVDYNIRKTGHVTEYLILTLLAFRALQGGLPTPRGRVFAGAFGIAVGYAVTDELHQAFVPGRTPSPVDVLIDSGGATIALTLLAIFMGYKQIERGIRRLENEQKT